LQFLQGGIIFAGELDENGSVVNVTPKLFSFIDCCLQAAALAEHFLRAVLVVPEVRLPRLFFYSCKLGVLASGSKKPPQLCGARGQVFVFLSQFFNHR